MTIDKRIQYRVGGASGREYDQGGNRNTRSAPNIGGGGGKDASTTSFDKSINPNRPGGPIGRDDSGVPGPDRSKVSQFSQYGKNVMNQNLDPTLKFDPRTGGMKKSFGAGLGSFLGTLLGFATGNPFVSLAMGGFDRLKRFNQRLQNTDFGRSTSLMDFLDMRKYGGYDEREKARRKNMEEAGILRGLIEEGQFGLPTSNRERALLGIPAISNVVPFDATTFDATTFDDNVNLMNTTPGGITTLYDEFIPATKSDDSVPLPTTLDLGNNKLLMADASKDQNREILEKLFNPALNLDEALDKDEKKKKREQELLKELMLT